MYRYSESTLEIIKTFAAAPETVFEAWVQPHKMKKWLFTQEATNKLVINEPRVGGTWEIIDHREGTDYRAIGKYLTVGVPHKLAFTFQMPQFNEAEDTITVELEQLESGCRMTFLQRFIVPHEEGWQETDIEQAVKESYEGYKEGWELMFTGLRELVEGST